MWSFPLPGSETKRDRDKRERVCLQASPVCHHLCCFQQTPTQPPLDGWVDGWNSFLTSPKPKTPPWKDRATADFNSGISLISPFIYLSNAPLSPNGWSSDGSISFTPKSNICKRLMDVAFIRNVLFKVIFSHRVWLCLACTWFNCVCNPVHTPCVGLEWRWGSKDLLRIPPGFSGSPFFLGMRNKKILKKEPHWLCMPRKSWLLFAHTSQNFQWLCLQAVSGLSYLACLQLPLQKLT